MFRLGCALVAATLAVSACGSTKEDRTVSGAGLGAGVGAVVGAVTGLSVLEGAALGAVAGGATGLLTDENDVSLGDPVWKQGSSDLAREIQTDLVRLGYDPGPVDGKPGPKTREAISRYQQDHMLLVDGKASPELAQHIRQQVQRAGG